MSLSLTLSILSSKLTPEEISAILSVEPDGVAVRGLDRVPARFTPPKNGWYLSSAHSDDAVADEALSALIRRIPDTKLLRLRAQDEELEIRVTIYFDRGRADTSLDLDPDLLAALAALRAQLFVDHIDLSIEH